jgi:hypothetical protein
VSKQSVVNYLRKKVGGGNTTPRRAAFKEEVDVEKHHTAYAQMCSIYVWFPSLRAVLRQVITQNKRRMMASNNEASVYTYTMSPSSYCPSRSLFLGTRHQERPVTVLRISRTFARECTVRALNLFWGVGFSLTFHSHGLGLTMSRARPTKGGRGCLSP